MADPVCPQCAKTLDTLRSGDLVGEACEDCGGIWLSIAVAKRIARALDEASIAFGERASARATVPFPRHREDPPCPDCGLPMKRTEIPSTRVVVDVCDAHGTWMDRGELATMVRTLATWRKSGQKPDRVEGDDALRRLGAANDDEQPRTFASATANAALDVAEDVAATMAVDVALGLIGAWISGNRRD